MNIGEPRRTIFIEPLLSGYEVSCSPRRDALVARHSFERAIGQTRVSPTEVFGLGMQLCLGDTGKLPEVNVARVGLGARSRTASLPRPSI